jgi:hypothetical protein
MAKHLFGFLIFYNFERRHSSLKKELKVKTPFDAAVELNLIFLMKRRICLRLKLIKLLGQPPQTRQILISKNIAKAIV